MGGEARFARSSFSSKLTSFKLSEMHKLPGVGDERALGGGGVGLERERGTEVGGGGGAVELKRVVQDGGGGSESSGGVGHGLNF